MTITFRVYGKPITQGSKRHVGNGRMVEQMSATLKPWRAAVTAAAVAAVPDDFIPFNGPLEVELAFYLPRPKTVTREYPHVRFDTDKLTRAVFDSITAARIWRDDCLVTDLAVCKRYADEHTPAGVYAVIWPL